MRGNFVGNYSPIYYKPKPHALPPSASPVPTAQPSQRFDLLPDFWQGGAAWQPWLSNGPVPQRLLPPSASPVPTAQPSQRFDPLPDFWQGGVAWQTLAKVLPPPPVVVAQQPYVQPARWDAPVEVSPVAWQAPPHALPPSASPVPTHQPSQRFDPLSDDPWSATVPWQPWLSNDPVPQRLLPPSASPVPTAQPAQRFDAPAAFDFIWWEAQAPKSQPLVINYGTEFIGIIVFPDVLSDHWWQSNTKVQPPAPPPPTNPPTAQPSQRFDLLPDFWQGGAAWQPWLSNGPVPQRLLPPSASPVPTAQPSQRFDPLPDFWQGGVAWQTLAKVLPPPPVVVAQQPYVQPARWDAPVEVSPVAWQAPPHALPPSASPVPTHQPSQRYDAPADFWAGCVPWVPLPVKSLPSAISASPVPTIASSQRFDSAPTLDTAWWDLVFARALPATPALIFGPLVCVAVQVFAPGAVAVQTFTAGAVATQVVAGSK